MNIDNNELNRIQSAYQTIIERTIRSDDFHYDPLDGFLRSMEAKTTHTPDMYEDGAPEWVVNVTAEQIQEVIDAAGVILPLNDEERVKEIHDVVRKKIVSDNIKEDEELHRQEHSDW